MAKVLMVDDEADMEFLVRQKFKAPVKTGEFELLFAKNGNEALNIIENDSIDVLISDVNMPGMDGLTLIERVKKLSPETRSIIVSAYGDMETLRKAMNRGAFDFVIKPVDYADLYEAVSKSISNCSTTRNILNSYKNHLKAKALSLGLPWMDIKDPKALFDIWQIDEGHLGLVCLQARSDSMESPLPSILTHNKLLCIASIDPKETLQNLARAMGKDTNLDLGLVVYSRQDKSIVTSNFGAIEAKISNSQVEFTRNHSSSSLVSIIFGE